MKYFDVIILDGNVDGVRHEDEGQGESRDGGGQVPEGLKYVTKAPATQDEDRDNSSALKTSRQLVPYQHTRQENLDNDDEVEKVNNVVENNKIGKDEVHLNCFNYVIIDGNVDGDRHGEGSSDVEVGQGESRDGGGQVPEGLKYLIEMGLISFSKV